MRNIIHKCNDKKAFIAVFSVLLFILIVLIANEFTEEIASYLDHGFVSMVLYVLIGVISIIVPPIMAAAFVPIGVALWGSFITFVLSVLAWSMGAIIAFLIARKYGRTTIQKYINLKPLEKYENKLGEKNLFWIVLLLRTCTSVGILSYAVGIFTKMKVVPYTIATILGIIPFAYIFSYIPDLFERIF